MGRCDLILSSSFCPAYDEYNIQDVRILVWCDGDFLTELVETEVKKLTIDSGSHLFQFLASFSYSSLDQELEYLDYEDDDEMEDSVTFRSSRVVDLPSGQQFVLLEEDTMRQFEQWRYNRKKDSEEFQQTMDQVIKDMGVRL